MVAQLSGNPYLPIAQGLRDIGQGYARGVESTARLRMQQESLDRQKDLDRINLLFKSMQALVSLEVPSEEIVSEYAPKIKELTDGVVDWTNIDFKKTSLDDAISFSNDVFDQIRGGTMDVETAGHKLVDYRATLQKKKGREYVKSKIGLLPIIHKKMAEEQKLKTKQADNIAKWQVEKGVIDITDRPEAIKELRDKGNIVLYGERVLFVPEKEKEKKELSTLELARKAFVEGTATEAQKKLLGKEKKVDKPTGTLTEGVVLTQIDNFTLDLGKPELKSKMYDRYLKLRKTSSREVAYNQMMKEYQSQVYDKPEDVKNAVQKNHITIEEGQKILMDRFGYGK